CAAARASGVPDVRQAPSARHVEARAGRLPARRRGVSQRVIRRAVLDDARSVATIQVQGWQWGYRGVMPEQFLTSLSIDERETQWRPQLESTDRPKTWLLVEGEAPIAFATCGPARDSDADEATGELYAIYQLESAAGTGAGRALIAHTMEDLRQERFTRAT